MNLIDWLIALGLFSLALWLRATDLIHFVTADEHNWIYRSGLFLHAFLQKDWPGTSVWLTPAVTTTWLGSASLALYYQIHEASINQSFLEWLVSLPRNKIDLDILLVLRWSMVLCTSLMITVVYGLARKLWSRPVALLGAVLLLAEPDLLAVSRIIGHDALITFFVTGSLLSFFYAKRLLPQAQIQAQPGFLQKVSAYRWFILSGIFAGLAILSKAPALILVPFTGLIAISDIWQAKNSHIWPQAVMHPAETGVQNAFCTPGRGVHGRLKGWIWALLIWGGVLWLTFILVWPAAWAAPLGQTWAVLSNALLSSAGVEDADIQPYWSTPDLGSFYYLINGAFKISPFLMIGLFLAGIGSWLKLRSYKTPLLDLINKEFGWLFLFSILFGILMTLGVKKSPRYILPILPALAYIAAWGWLNPPINLGQGVLQRFWKAGIIAVLGSLALWLTLNYAPYYFTYFNPLLGGSVTAPKLVRIGWGEGLDELGRWLNARPDAMAGQVGARYTATLYPFYQRAISSPVSDELDYVAFYIKQSQSGYPAPEILAYFENQELLHRVALNGIEYVRVYQGPGMQLVKSGGQSNLPIAYRPYTIYAPIGGRLTVDLLWPISIPRSTENDVNLILKSSDSSILLASRATITEKAPEVSVSTHNFDLPVDIARSILTLYIDDKPLGEIKTRLIDLPPRFTPLSIVLGQRLKLAGLHHRRAGNDLWVDLAWQGWPKAANDYTVFIQLLDKNGQRVTGVDVLPERGFTTLDRKEIMLIHYVISLPGDLKPGPYTMLVGLYYFAGGELINVGAVKLPDPVILD
jgi:hypothetical protein